MIQVLSKELKPGMVLGKSIYRDDGELLLASGYSIHEKVLPKIQELDQPCFWIQEEGTEFIIPESMISDQIALQSQAAIKDNLELIKKVVQTQEDTLDAIHKNMRDSKKFKNIILADQVKKSVRDIIESLMAQESTQINLNSIRSKGAFLYQHALDVTITAIVIANKLHFNRFELEELALGCMLMDLGMVVLPDSLSNKNGRLTFQEFTMLKEHTTFGYAILKENNAIPLVSAHIAYQHHERQDGAGYPRRLRGNNDTPTKRLSPEKGMIHRYAEIAAVADTYIALTSPRPHQATPKSPEQAIRTLITAASSQLNRTIIDTLITIIPVYPVGTRIVIIQDDKYNMQGYNGIVSRYRSDVPDKPCVMIMFNRDRKKIKPLVLDLLEEPGIKIQFVVLT